MDVQPRVVTIEIAGAVAVNAVAKDQILCASRGTNRVRLYEAHRLEGGQQRRLGEEAARDGVPAQIVDGHSGARSMVDDSNIILDVSINRCPRHP